MALNGARGPHANDSLAEATSPMVSLDAMAFVYYMCKSSYAAIVFNFCLDISFSSCSCLFSVHDCFCCIYAFAIFFSFMSLMSRFFQTMHDGSRRRQKPIPVEHKSGTRGTKRPALVTSLTDFFRIWVLSIRWMTWRKDWALGFSRTLRCTTMWKMARVLGGYLTLGFCLLFWSRVLIQDGAGAGVG